MKKAYNRIMYGISLILMSLLLMRVSVELGMIFLSMSILTLSLRAYLDYKYGAKITSLEG
ncbi:MAG: hypothetical protein ACI35P_01485 [Bacillus sp. (in: firmicutes)]